MDGLSFVNLKTKLPLGQIVQFQNRINKRGYAPLSKVEPEAIAKSKIQKFYTEIKQEYDNAELIVAPWQAGISSLRNGDNHYGGLCSHAGKYYIGQDNGLFSTTDYIAGELTQINNVITSDIYCFDNIIIQRNAAGGLNKIDYETLTTTSILSFFGQLTGGSLKCHKEDDGYIYITDASLFTVHRILDAADAEIELVYTHGTTAVYDCRKKGTKFVVVAADGIYTTTDFVTMSLKYDIDLNGATLLYHVATNKFIVVPFSEGGDVPVYTSVDEFENIVEVATGVVRNTRTAYLDGSNLYIPAIGGDPYNASYYTQTIANIAVGWTRVAIANTNITWMTFFGTTMLATVSDKLYYSGLVKKTYTKIWNINGSDITITYYLGASGNQICISETTQNEDLAIIYDAVGSLPYFILDTVNSTLVLPRINFPYTYMYIGGTYINTSDVQEIFERYATISEAKKNIFTQLASKTVGSDGEEHSLLDVEHCAGSLLIPANSLKAGNTIRATIRGKISSHSVAPTTTLKFKVGHIEIIDDVPTMVYVELIANAGLLTANLNGIYFETNILITVRAIGTTGKMILDGNSFFKDAINISAGIQRVLMGNEVTVNTSLDNTIDMTYLFDAANESNTITVDQAVFDILR